MRVIALFRVSTEQQATDGASLDAQQRTYRKLAQANGWTTVAEFRGCESATKASSEREVLQRVLRSIRDEDPDAIYVHEQSRLTRGDELEVASLLRELRERQVKILVAGVVRDLGSLDERFMVGIQSLVDRLESERIKERVHRGKREKARAGLKNSGPTAFGYRNPLPGQPGRGRLEIVPEQAIVVQTIFELAASGLGRNAIASQLNAMGHKSPRGNTWGKTSVQRVLQNPLYIGVQASSVWVAEPGSRTFRLDLDNPSAVIVPDAHPAIITRSQWDAAHGGPRPVQTAQPRMLSGLVHLNGHAAKGDSEHGEKIYRTRHGLGIPAIEMTALDNCVWEAFTGLFQTPDYLAALVATQVTDHGREAREMEVAGLKTGIAKLRLRLDRLVEMRADGEIDRDQFRDKKAAAERALTAQQRQLADLASRISAADPARVAGLVTMTRTVLARSDQLTQNDRRELLRAAVRSVDVAVTRRKVQQPRDERGRLQRPQHRCWAFEAVTFDLLGSDPPSEGPSRTQHSSTTPINCVRPRPRS